MTESLRNGAEELRRNGADGFRHPGTTLKPISVAELPSASHLSLLETAPERSPDPVAPMNSDDEGFARDAYIAALELRIRELVEIEKMRDLEIRNLEAEAGQQADRIHSLEVALFHAERRGADLDRRWNDLAAVYEQAAAALVIAGGTLEQIHQQAGYRAILRLNRMIRTVPLLNRAVHRARPRHDTLSTTVEHYGEQRA